MHLKMSSAKWRPFCLGLNVLTMTQISVPQDILAICGSVAYHRTGDKPLPEPMLMFSVATIFVGHSRADSWMEYC